MATVHDVAAFIRREHPGTRGKKLQKLVYYAQAWSTVWDGTPLFAERIEAWREGPVSPHLYGEEVHNGVQTGNADALTPNQSETVRGILRGYGSRSAEWLSRLSHRETPWLSARGGLPPSAKSKNVIAIDAMRSFYERADYGSRKHFDDAYLLGLDLLVETPEEEIALLSDKQTLDATDFLQWMETGDEDLCDSSK